MGGGEEEGGVGSGAGVPAGEKKEQKHGESRQGCSNRGKERIRGKIWLLGTDSKYC